MRIEDLVWMQVDGFDKIWGLADEDLERSTDSKTSAVNFLRFEVTDQMARGLKNGANWSIGVEHPAYTYKAELDGSTRKSLLNDLES